jgi:acyl dehydratase
MSTTANSVLTVGATAPTRDVGPLTTQMLVRYAGASGDFNPMHYDDIQARGAGYPSVFAQGMFSAGLLAGYAVDWLGAANVRRFGVRFREQVWPGDTLTCAGVVKAIEERDGGRLVTVELTATRQTGAAALTATADFHLPA